MRLQVRLVLPVRGGETSHTVGVLERLGLASPLDNTAVHTGVQFIRPGLLCSLPRS
jgi:hypothetical protein